MIRTRFAATVAALGLLAAPAFAQTMNSHPANGSTNTNSGSMNSATPSEAAPATTASNNSGSGSTGSSLMGDRIQEVHGGYLSSKLVGATVYNDQKQSIGSIDNLLVDPNGKITTAVISVGGFLGVGSKLVEVPYSQLQFRPDSNNSGTGREVVLPNATEQSLKSMQVFSYNS